MTLTHPNLIRPAVWFKNKNTEFGENVRPTFVISINFIENLWIELSRCQ